MRVIVRIAVLLLVVVVAGAVGVLANLAHSRRDQPRGIHGSIPAPPPDDSGSARLVGAETGSAGRAVDSFSPADQYSLIDWVQDSGEAGGIDQATVAGPHPRSLGDGPVEAGDILQLSGWAGDPVLGIRFTTVVFTACGKVIGAAAVTMERPEITRWVHPNLSPAGWTARLAVAHLPACDNVAIRAWAVHAARFIYPLEGRVSLSLPDADHLAAVPVTAGAAVMRPDEQPRLDRAAVSVGADGAVLRRCANSGCEAVGTLAEGVHASAVLDRRGAWTLIVAENQAGWLETPTDDTAEPAAIDDPVNPAAETPPPS